MKKILFLFLAIFTVILTSCDDYDSSNQDNSNLKGFNLSYSVSKNVSATTRASIPLEEGEDNLNSLYILFFENTSGGTGLFIEAIDAKSGNETILSSSGNIAIEFPEGSKLNGSTNYNILLCANIGEYTTASLQNLTDIEEYFRGYTEKEVVATLLQISGVDPEVGPIAEQQDDSNKIAISNLPMSASAVKAANQSSVTIELTRTVSRFDVFCQAPGYELVSASVWNAHTVVPVWENAHRDFSEPRTERYYGVKANDNKEIVGSLYAFENYVAKPTQNDKKTTCLIIGLRKEGSQDVEYFRANINATNMGQQLKRNNMYRSTVRSVNSEGAETERKAYENSELLIDIDINGWTLDDSGNFHQNGDNILSIPTQLIELSPMGETREYNVFTLGEGTLEISDMQLPENVTAKLKGNLLIVTATASQEYGEGMIQLSFAGMSGQIRITQEKYEYDYLDLNIYELPFFSSAKGQVSSNIEVTSSGEWIAEIYNSDYFSFESGTTQVNKTEGFSGSQFNIQTILANTNENIRYGFVLVKLKEKPDVSRVILLGQAGTKTFYLTVTPNTFQTFPAGGGYTENITVNASGRFKAELSVNTNIAEALFVDPLQDDEEEDENENENTSEPEEKTYKTWDSRNNGNQFAIRISALTALNISAEITLTVYLYDDNNVKEVIKIQQNALSTGNLVVQTRNHGKAGSLFRMNKGVTKRYVYNLATNMRDTNLFGPYGRVNQTEGYVFSSGTTAQEITHIFQVTGSMTSSQGKALKTWIDKSDRRFAFITHNAGYASTSVKRINANFPVDKPYAVIDPNIAASSPRYINKELEANNKLLSYLLTGPFGSISAEDVNFKGKSIQNRGLTDWPSTFIPIIMGVSETSHTRGKEVCLFGIDPVMRLIWVTDPAIFGSQKSSDPNSGNYPAGSANEKFLNNFIAWLTYAATQGEDFLKDFK